MAGLAVRAAGRAAASFRMSLALPSPLTSFRPVLAVPSGAAAARAAGAGARVAAAAAGGGAPARGLTGMTRRRRNEIRRAAALAKRNVLAFAELFDPARTARLQLAATMRKLGWDATEGEAVAGLDGPHAQLQFALREWFVAFDVVPAANWVLPSDERASTDAGWGPGVEPPIIHPDTGIRGVRHPSAGPFPYAPLPWRSPVRGLVLDKVTAERHAAVRGKGWKVVVVPAPLWEYAAGHVHRGHRARRDLLLSLTVPWTPFEERPEADQAKAREVITEARKAERERAFAGMSAVAAAVAASAGGVDDATRARIRAEAVRELRSAQEASHSGRSRRARGDARRRVSEAVEANIDSEEGRKKKRKTK
jgi:hypothetical protein